MCAVKFPDLICRPIAAQFMTNNLVALFAFEQAEHDIAISLEKHYRLVSAEQIGPQKDSRYRNLRIFA